MSLAVGPFGIEYDPRRRDPGSPFLRVLVALVLVASAVSLGVTFVRRVRGVERETPVPVDVPETPAKPEAPPAPEPPQEPPAPPIRLEATDIRPVKVRNLMLRLEEAENRRDIVLAVSTIEQLLALPGHPVADKEDELARRLGSLNLRWLFERYNAQWVVEVAVKSGDSASRIARDHGATLASLKRLNPSVDLDRVRTGQKLRTMDRPRFNLIVHRSNRLADLMLNDKFFKRYDLRAAVDGAAGLYENPGNLRTFLAEKGIWFSQDDRNELEVLLPKGARLHISDL